MWTLHLSRSIISTMSPVSSVSCCCTVHSDVHIFSSEAELRARASRMGPRATERRKRSSVLRLNPSIQPARNASGSMTYCSARRPVHAAAVPSSMCACARVCATGSAVPSMVAKCVRAQVGHRTCPSTSPLNCGDVLPPQGRRRSK